MQHKIRLTGIDAPERAQAFCERSKRNLSVLVAGLAPPRFRAMWVTIGPRYLTSFTALRLRSSVKLLLVVVMDFSGTHHSI